MPKREKRVIITWTCDVCHKKYPTEKEAVACENRGMALPEFKKLDLVTITLKEGKEVIGQVIDYGPYDDDECQNPHQLPDLYGVNITYRDYNPCNYTPQDNNPLRMLGHNGFSRSIMKLYIANKSVCPICRSADIQRGIEEGYLPYFKLWQADIGDVEVCRCGHCGLRFFNKKQSGSVNQKIRAKLQGVKLASTKKLIKNREIQY